MPGQNHTAEKPKASNGPESLQETAWETGRSGAKLTRSHTHHTAGISGEDKRVTPRAHYVKLSSGGHTLGRSDRPHATASIDPKGYSRMRGTATDRSVHHPWVLLSGGTGDMNAATETKVARPKGRHRGTRMGRRRRNLPHSQVLIIGHHWPVEPETVRQ